MRITPRRPYAQHAYLALTRAARRRPRLALVLFALMMLAAGWCFRAYQRRPVVEISVIATVPSDQRLAHVIITPDGRHVLAELLEPNSMTGPYFLDGRSLPRRAMYLTQPAFFGGGMMSSARGVGSICMACWASR